MRIINKYLIYKYHTCFNKKLFFIFYFFYNLESQTISAYDINLHSRLLKENSSWDPDKAIILTLSFT